MSLPFSIGNPFTELQQVESTNNYATGLVHAGLAQSGMAVFTHNQTSGKGQREKGWQSEPGKNIALSVILQPPLLSYSQSFLLSMATAVGVHQFFSDYAGEEAKIKWPNDLYWRDRKAGGILIENSLQGSIWKAAVIGIGINVNQTSFADVSLHAVSLKQITGKDFEPVLLAKQLCDALSKAYYHLHKAPADLVERYRNALYKKGEMVRLKQGSRVFEAVIKTVLENGELVVEHGTEERFATGELEWVR